MAQVNIENNICDAIEVLVNKKIEDAGYDKTILAEIIEGLDTSIGKYKCKYQDSDFTAFATNLTVLYTKGQMVYVKIPANDTSSDKIILGLGSARTGMDFIDADLEEDTFDSLGYNGIINNASFALSSYQVTKELIIYDAEDKANSLVQVDDELIAANMGKSSAIQLGAVVRTALPTEQQFNGHYGASFVLEFENDADGSLIERIYNLDDVHFTGQPYRLIQASTQRYAYPIDTANFKRIKKIYLFSYNFPNEDPIKPKDIFISDLEFTSGEIVNAINSSLTKIVIEPATPSFTVDDTDDKVLLANAQLYIKGRPINSDMQDLEYYWFKEDVSITSKSPLYCEHGGEGWKCLNQSSPVTDISTMWVPGTSVFQTIKADNPVRNNRYKCVVVYKGFVIKKEFDVVNYSADITLELISDAGTQFYFDIGSPNLTCLVSGRDELEAFDYKWLREMSDGTITHYDNSPEEGEEYYAAILARDELQRQVDENLVLAGAAAEQLDNYQKIIDNYSEEMRIFNNHIFNVSIKEIDSYAIFKCSVYTKAGDYLGTATITLNNDRIMQGDYKVVIKNSTQLFKYDEIGVLSSSIEPQDLEFELFDNLDSLVPKETVDKKCDIKWIFPTEKTLLSISNKIPNQYIKNENGMNIVTTLQKIPFEIADNYDFANMDNQIQLQVTYRGVTLSAITNFTFMKEGNPGTNGTEYACQIVANTDGEDELPMVINGKINYSPKILNHWFKAQLWKSGKCIYRGHGAGISTEGKIVTVIWKNLKNSLDVSNIEISETGRCVYQAQDWDQHPANIIGCEITYEGKTYYGSLPVIVAEINDNRTIELLKYTGYQFVVYAADGTAPQWDAIRPFELKITENINGIDEDISKIQNEYKLDYAWDTQGRVFTKDRNTYFDTNSLDAVSAHNTCIVTPKAVNDGECLNDALTCIITRGGSEIGNIYIPIHLMLNRYGQAAINAWDGNSVSIDKNGNGVILAPQVGAGVKNTDNSFTGMLMGKVREAGKETQDIGLLGYAGGERTVFLNSQNGSAIFGKNNSGQIIIDPSTDAAMLYSNDYWKNYISDGIDAGLPTSYDDDNLNGKGMLIDLTEPKIVFGNGNFKVSKEGHLTAKGGGSIAGWNLDDNSLYTKTKDDTSNIRLSSADGAFARTINGTNRENLHLAFGTKFAVDKDGNIYAGGGDIAGWKINSNSLTAGNITLNSEGSMSGGSGDKAWSISKDGDATFKTLYASNKGTIGGWTIDGTKLTGGNTTINSSGNIDCTGGAGWYIHNDGSAKFGNFSVNTAGAITAQGGTFNDITANRGTFKSITVDGNSIFKGKLSGASGDFSGKITATEGTIGGWTISGTSGFKTDHAHLNPNGNLEIYPQVGSGGEYKFNDGMTLHSTASQKLESGANINLDATQSIRLEALNSIYLDSGSLYVGTNDTKGVTDDLTLSYVTEPGLSIHVYNWELHFINGIYVGKTSLGEQTG